MKRLAVRVAYFGDRFYGSQMQPDRRTVEGEFVAACRTLKLFDDWREANFSFAGRTDRGVHSRGQVAAFSTGEPDRAVAALNLVLPEDCWCTGWAEVPERFRPRYDARTRTYRYFFPERALDAGLMQEAAGRFVGEHDFSRFARVEDKNPLRRILSSRITATTGGIVYEVVGESFLWNMVRCMATALWAAGEGRLTPAEVDALLETPAGERIRAAPADGLVLWDVDCGLHFAPLATDPRSRRYCSALRDELSVRKKVMASLCRPGVDFGRQEPVDDELRDIV
ncbi:MAG: tRNA pseudouridine(38-40) synthase TruA [Methanomicrobiales archaeon]|nr:tRNA pseudouridine(38-40) synthase TruA [Methanomicrobiales archaeon]